MSTLRIITFLFDFNLIWLYIIPGIIILALSVYMRDRSHKDLFDTRVEGIASVGVYGRVRHPMYLGTFLFYLGLSVITFSIAALAIWLVTVAYYNSLANYEESLLEERFGNEYLEYKKNVRKWIPV